MSSELPKDAPEPRLCHLVKWPDFDGYGFNLHAEKAKSGQFIGKVDDDSPADHAALKEGDRIIEVNGVNIANENHRQVVERIKAVPNETKLLVLDGEADRWYKERKLVVKGNQANVKYMKTPVPRPTAKPDQNGNADLNGKAEPKAKPSVENSVSTHTNGTESPEHSETQSLAESSRSSTPKTEPKRDSPATSPADSPRPSAPTHAPKAQNGKADLNNSNGVPNGTATATATPPAVNKTPSSKADTKPSSDSKPAPATNGSSKAPQDTANGAKPSSGGKTSGAAELNFNLSVAEMRERLANKKKSDPKKQSMDMREKYQIVQQM